MSACGTSQLCVTGVLGPRSAPCLLLDKCSHLFQPRLSCLVGQWPCLAPSLAAWGTRTTWSKWFTFHQPKAHQQGDVEPISFSAFSVASVCLPTHLAKARESGLDFARLLSVRPDAVSTLTGHCVAINPPPCCLCLNPSLLRAKLCSVGAYDMVHWLPVAAITNCYKFTGFKYHKIILS